MHVVVNYLIISCWSPLDVFVHEYKISRNYFGWIFSFVRLADLYTCRVQYVKLVKQPVKVYGSDMISPPAVWQIAWLMGHTK